MRDDFEEILLLPATIALTVDTCSPVSLRRHMEDFRTFSEEVVSDPEVVSRPGLQS